MVLGFPLDTIAILWLGALISGVAAGGSGFAFALAASSIWLHRIDPLHSVIMCTGCGVLLHLTTIWPQRKYIEAGRLWPFIVGGIAGVPIGVRLLAFTDASLLKLTLGLFLIVFGLYAFIAPRLHTISGGGRSADAAIGFIGGIMGGVGGYSGVLPTIWTQLRGWPKEIARGVYQPYVIIMQGMTLVGIILVTFDWQGLTLMLAVLPPLLLGTWIGWQLYSRLNGRRFRQILGLPLMGSGLTLAL
jgi:uncharacterized membrane protein YfcA